MIIHRIALKYGLASIFILLFFINAPMILTTGENHQNWTSPQPINPGMAIASDEVDYVDIATSDIDSSPDIGSHSDFVNQQTGPDAVYDTLSEINADPAPTNTENDIDIEASNVDSSPDLGVEGIFANAQGTSLDSSYLGIQEESISQGYGGETGSVLVTGSIPDMADKDQFCLYQAIFWNPTDTIYQVSRVEFNYTGSQWLNAISQGSGVSYPISEWYLSNKQVAYWAGSSPINVQPHTVQSFYITGDSNRINSGFYIDIRITANSTTYIETYHSAQSNGNRPAAQLWLGSTTPPNQIHSISPSTQTTVYVSVEEAANKADILSGGTLTIDVPFGFTSIQDIGGTGWDSASIVGSQITVSNNVLIRASYLTYAFRITSPSTPGLYKLDVSFTDGLYAMPIGNFTIHVTGTPATTEKIDLEYQWTSAMYSAPNEKVCIYIASHSGTETLNANYWNGFSWNSLGSITSTGWTNFTATGLTTSTYTIQLIGNSESSDSSKDTWNIDLITLHTWSTQTYNYKLDLEVQWSSANYTQASEELCIYTGDLDSESIRVDVWTGSDWTNIATDLTANTWNNFSISSWLTSSIFTIRFRGDIETGDLTQSSWEIDCSLIHIWDNSDPQNTASPVISNIDSGNYLYAEYRQYLVTANVTDADGFADIDYLEMTLTSNDRLTEFWTVRFDEDTNSFSEESDPNGYIVLDVASSTYSKTSSEISASFNITITWDHPDVTNADVKCSVYDSNPSSDVDYFEVDWNIETRLDLSSGFSLNDGSGTTNRGDIDGSIIASGTIIYLGSTFHPKDGEIDVWISESEYGSVTGPWEATNYEESGGTFAVTVYADDTVGLDTFTVLAVKEGTGPTGDNNFNSSQTAQYMADRVQVQSFSTDDSRINTNSSASLHILLYYDYDNSYVTDGTVTVNGLTATYSGSNGVWDFSDSQNTAQQVTYNAVTYSDGAHGLTELDMNGQSIAQIWDNIKVASYSTIDAHVDINSDATIDVTIIYEYDDAPVTTGTVTINGISATHQGGGVWRIVQAAGSVQSVTYNSVACSGNIYGITLVDQNDKSQVVVWDRVIVESYSVTDERANINDVVNLTVSLKYEYDSSSITSGTVTINSLPATHIGSGIWQISVSKSSVQSVTYNLVACSGNTYGISEINQNSQSQLIIWDQITVRSYSISNGRVNIDDSVNIDVTLEYEYDDTPVTSGSVSINGNSATHQSAGVWRLIDTKSSLQSITYNTVTCSGNDFDITSVNQNSQSASVIWDTIVVRSYTVVDTRVNLDDSVNIDILLEYEYDDSLVTDGSVTINTIAASYVGSGIWRITESKSSVQSITYDSVICSGNVYEITEVNQNSQSIEVIWDQVVVRSYSVLDARVNIITSVEINFTLEYEFDNSLVTDGTVTLNGISAIHQEDGIWQITQSRSSVLGVTYNNVLCSGNLYGINDVNQNSQSQLIIWDQITVRQYEVTDARVNLDDNVNIEVTIEYEYDDSPVIDGTVTISSYSATHQGSGVWRITQSRSSVQGITYNAVVCSSNILGITSINQNGQSQLVIWDQITVRGYEVSDSRDNVGDNIIVTVELEYEYDDSDVIDGVVTINSVSFIYTGTLGKWSASRMQSSVTDETFDAVSVASNSFGITDVNQNSKSQLIIWDRIQVVTTSVDDARINIGAYCEIRVTLILEYDSTPLGSGDIVTLNGASMTWDASDARFELARQKATVGRWIYFVNSSLETTYGISNINLNSQQVSVIWDSILILTTVVDDARVSINSNVELRVTAQLAFDGHPLESGDSILLDSSSMTWDGVNSWFELARSKSSVGLWNFQVASASETTYGITAVDLNGQSQDVIWDRLNINIVADMDSVPNNIQVNFTMTVAFEYDLVESTSYSVRVYRDNIYWHTFTEPNITSFYDSNSDVTYAYNVTTVNSESIFGITVFVSNIETVIWGGSTAAPVNDNVPVLVNPDDSNYMFARLRFYIITSNVSDLQGYSDIDFVELSLWNNARSSEIWRIRFTESTNTFSIESGSDYIELSTGSSYVKSGNNLDIIWLIKIDWDHLDLSNIDLRQYVIDSSLLSDTNWYEADWNIETRLDYSTNPILSDDRGDLNTNDLECTGIVVYLGSLLHPLANETDVWVLHDISGSWSGILNATGGFAISNIASSSSVRLNTYTIKVVNSGDGFSGTDLYYTTSRTNTFITDRIEFYLSGVEDERINVNNTGVVWWSARYDYDNVTIVTGLVAQMNGSKVLGWDAANSQWYYEEVSQSIAKIGYSLFSATESGFGLTGWTQTASDVLIIWDLIVVRSYSVVNTRVNISDVVSIDVVLEYDFDDSYVEDGTVLINSVAASYQGLGIWRISQSQSIVGSMTYNSVSCINNGYNITLVNQNLQSQSVIWDRILVVSYVVTDNHINVDDTVNIDVTLVFEYDSSSVLTGSVTIDGISATHQGIGVWRIIESKSSIQSITYDTVTCTGNIFGISVVNQNSLFTTVIWDQIVVQYYTVLDTRVNVDDSVSIDVKLVYGYSGSDVTDGSVFVNGLSATHISNGIWRFSDSESAVQDNIYNSVICSGNFFGLTNVDQNGKSATVIWDRIIVQSYDVDDNHVDINTLVYVNVTLEYEYDNSAVLNGVVIIQSTSAIHIGNGVWQISITKSFVQMITLDTILCSSNSYGITSVNQNAQDISIIWDKITVRGYSVSDIRINVDDYAPIDVELEYEYDDSSVTNGVVTINGIPATHIGVGIWRINETSGSIQAHIYNLVVSTGNLYGITVIDQNLQSVTIIWDQIIVRSYLVLDERVNLGTVVNIDITLEYDYDNTDVETGLVTINGNTAAYRGSGVWRISVSESVVTSNTYNVVICSGNAYDITNVNQNGKSVVVIWDQITVRFLTASDPHDNIGSTIIVSITLEYEYDDSDVTDGLVIVNSISFSYTGSNGIWSANRLQNSVTSETFDAVVTSGNTHGITGINLNGQSLVVIWDRIRILTTSVDDSRVNTNSPATVLVTAELEYDGHQLSAGDSLFLDDTLMVWDGPNSRFFLDVTHSVVGQWKYYVNGTGAFESTYGITAIDTRGLTRNVIWDELSITITPDETLVQDFESVSFAIYVEFSYDSSQCTSYILDISRNATSWLSFSYPNRSLFIDVNSNLMYNYSTMNVASESIYGITVFVANTVVVTWSTPTNFAPINNAAPVLQNPDDTNVLYAKLRTYSITSSILDYDGFSNLDYVELSLWDNTRTSEIWRLRFTVSNHSFSIQTGSNYLEISSTSAYLESGYLLNITWIIKIDWDHPDIQNVDVRQYALDQSLASDNDWYESNWKFETRLDYSTGPYLSDDRGDVNTADLQVSGSVVYYGSLLVPLSNETDIWVIHDFSGSWSSDVNVLGTFSISGISSSNVVRLNTYTFKIVVNGTGPSSTDLFYTASLTGTFITDQIVFYISGVTDSRININTQCDVWWKARYQYDGTDVQSGLIAYLNGAYLLSWDSVNARWYYQESRNTAVRREYQVSSATESDFGITLWTQTAPNQAVIWDSLIVTITDPIDQRIDVNTNASGIIVSAVYRYDMTPFDGTIILNNSIFQYSSVQRQYYTVASVFGDAYGITTISVNDMTWCIWDQIEVVSISTNITYLDPSEFARVQIYLCYDFDDAPVLSGMFSLKFEELTHIGDGTWEVNVTRSSYQAVHFDSLTTCNGTVFGISSFDMYGNSRSVYWDRLEFYESSTSDSRINIGSTGFIMWSVKLQTAGIIITSGLIAEVNDGSPLVYIDGYWRSSHILYTVGDATFTIISASLEGIDFFTRSTSDVTVIWDRIRVTTTSATSTNPEIEQYIQIQATLVYEYDNTPVVDGVVSLWDQEGQISMVYNVTGGFWYANLTKVDVGNYSFYISAVSGNQYGITEIDLNGHIVTVQFVPPLLPRLTPMMAFTLFSGFGVVLLASAVLIRKKYLVKVPYEIKQINQALKSMEKNEKVEPLDVKDFETTVFAELEPGLIELDLSLEEILGKISVDETQEYSSLETELDLQDIMDEFKLPDYKQELDEYELDVSILSESESEEAWAAMLKEVRQKESDEGRKVPITKEDWIERIPSAIKSVFFEEELRGLDVSELEQLSKLSLEEVQAIVDSIAKNEELYSFTTEAAAEAIASALSDKTEIDIEEEEEVDEDTKKMQLLQLLPSFVKEFFSKTWLEKLSLAEIEELLTIPEADLHTIVRSLAESREFAEEE
ncbi:MAG: hypothetical protein JW779_10715 [Candidatus Thorarchaeota archaeon]|nr:hypothetical protein [Candidatus Thorarchaeota archaeon]